MGTTSNNSWPYPESSDFVADGATAIQNLADAIDADFDTTVLNVDSVTNRVGINDAAPSYPLSVVGDINTTTDLRINGIAIGQYASYTPVLTATGTNPTLGTGSSAYGWFALVNDIVHYHFFIQFGTSGTNAGAGVYRVSLPVNAASSTRSIGTVQLRDASLARIEVATCDAIASSNIIEMFFDATGTFWAGNASPWAWAASDIITGTVVYRSA